VRGSALAWIEQVAEYFGGAPVESIDVSGNRFARSASGVETVTHGATWAWDAGAALGRARFWGILDGRALFEAHPEPVDDAYGGAWDPGSAFVIGMLGATVDDARAMRRLVTAPAAWRPAGTYAEWLVVLVDAASVTPDASWARWSTVVAGERVETRDAGARYWSLAPARNNVYAGDADQWTGLTLPGAGTDADGDPASFPLSTALPDGVTYAGNPATFPLTAQLVDDGDHL